MLEKVLILGLVLGVFNGCSKLEDYSTAQNSSPSPVSLPAAIHAWEFENSAVDSGSSGGWLGTSTGSYANSAGFFKVGSYALQIVGTALGTQRFSLGSVSLPAQATIACWLRWTSGGTATVNTVFANSTQAGVNGYFISVDPSTRLITVKSGDGASNLQLTSVSSLADGIYAHVAISLDSVAHTAAIYFNGALDQSGASQAGLSLTGVSSIGGTATAGTSFNGEIDDCRIYDQTFSNSQILTLYNSY